MASYRRVEFSRKPERRIPVVQLSIERLPGEDRLQRRGYFRLLRDEWTLKGQIGEAA